MDWNRPYASGRFDCIVASEVTYKQEECKSLTKLFETCLNPDGEVILAGEMRKSSIEVYKALEVLRAVTGGRIMVHVERRVGRKRAAGAVDDGIDLSKTGRSRRKRLSNARRVRHIDRHVHHRPSLTFQGVRRRQTAGLVDFRHDHASAFMPELQRAGVRKFPASGCP